MSESLHDMSDTIERVRRTRMQELSAALRGMQPPVQENTPHAAWCAHLAETVAFADRYVFPEPPLMDKPKPSPRAAILDAARHAVTVDRAATHGPVENTFAHIAGLWSVRLGVEISAAQVCIMMIDLKTARAWDNPGYADNWVDMAGYAACGGEAAGVADVQG